jgi:hypothetical protein
MADTPTKIVVDLSKPKGERESVVPLTAEEIAELEARAAQAELELQAAEAAQAEQQALKDSANAKLLALGLSPEEVAAITGN